MTLLNRLIDYVQAKFPPNRIVVLLTPFVFVPAAGYVSTWVARNVPGVQLSSTTLLGVFVSGSLAALAAATKWLDGWQKHEAWKAHAELLPFASNQNIHVRHHGTPGPVPVSAVVPPQEPEPPVDQHTSSTAPSESTGGSSPEAAPIVPPDQEAELRARGFPVD